MDTQEAIRLLHPDTTVETMIEIEYYGGFEGRQKVAKAIDEACIVACRALKKQIKMEVLNMKKQDDEMSGLCPVCDKPVHSFVGQNHITNYCKSCGQALKW